jgi:hypothetical protein
VAGMGRVPGRHAGRLERSSPAGPSSWLLKRAQEARAPAARRAID